MSSNLTSRARSKPRGLIAILLAVLGGLGYLGREFFFADASKADSPNFDSSVQTTGTTDPGAGLRAIREAFAQKKSDLLVEVRGRVKRTLADDREGSPHQKWILELEDGHTVLVAHNLDLAPRVPLQAGDVIIVRGEYEYSREGGVLHWTHDDPAGRHPGGWVELKGKRYE